MMPVDGRETDIGHQALRVFYSFEHPCNKDFACGQLISMLTNSRTRKTSCSLACLPWPGCSWSTAYREPGPKFSLLHRKHLALHLLRLPVLPLCREGQAKLGLGLRRAAVL